MYVRANKINILKYKETVHWKVINEKEEMSRVQAEEVIQIAGWLLWMHLLDSIPVPYMVCWALGGVIRDRIDPEIPEHCLVL